MSDEQKKTESPRSESSHHAQTGMSILIGILVVWMLIIALGTYLSIGIENRGADYRKPLFVIGTMGTFLGIWLFALQARKRKQD